jgi:hypothetical protein
LCIESDEFLLAPLFFLNSAFLFLDSTLLGFFLLPFALKFFLKLSLSFGESFFLLDLLLCLLHFLGTHII